MGVELEFVPINMRQGEKTMKKTYTQSAEEVLHDLGIDGCLPDIFGQCAESRRPRPVTDDVILQSAVSYGDGPNLLLHPARFRATAFVLLFHCSRINVYVCICVNMSMRKCVFV